MKVVQPKSNWDKEIDIRMTLRELQEIYCAIGNSSLKSRKDTWIECEHGNENCPFDETSNLFDDVEDILEKEGGCIV